MEFIIIDKQASQLCDHLKSLFDSDITYRIATNGESGYQLVFSSNPSLVIINQHLTKLNGFKLCQLISHNQHYHQVPVIMLVDLVESEMDQLLADLGTVYWYPLADWNDLSRVDSERLIAIIERAVPLLQAHNES